MCGRFTLTVVEGLSPFFEIDDHPPLRPRYNIAPSQEVPVVRLDSQGRRRMDLMTWGLVPPRETKASDGRVSAFINARSESASRKPSFRNAFRRRRGLIPADGFFEWQKAGRHRQPYYIRLKDHRLFALAALWEPWPDDAGEGLDTCTILTTAANPMVASIHNRMPVLLLKRQFESWLKDSDDEDFDSLLVPFPAAKMEMTAVDRVVNSPAVDGPECLAPAGPPEPRQPSLFD